MPDYELTEAEPFPSTWEIASLGEVTYRVGSGITPTGGAKVYSATGRPFIRSQNVGWGSLLLDDIAYIDEETHRSFSATEVNVNDVLLNITGASIGRTAVADERVKGGNVNQHVCIIRTIPARLDHHFLNQFLLSSDGQRQIENFQAGGNRQGLNFTQVRSFVIPLPPLAEQRVISIALSDLDACITEISLLIAKKRDLKQATQQELLTGRRRLPGFSGEWIEWEFADLFQFLKTGNSPRADLGTTGDVGYIHYGDIHGATSPFLDGCMARLPMIDATKVRTLPSVLDGDLIMADASEDTLDIGKCVEVRCLGGQRVVAGLHTFLLRGNRKLLADGYKGYLQFIPSVRGALVRSATGISVYGVSKLAVKRIRVLLPDRTEQAAIAAVLCDMDAEIAALEARREKTRLIKQGMMQELLTGKTRLI